MGLSILVVDDEPEICHFFRRLLEKQGYEVMLAQSGNDTEALLSSRDFSLALVDLKLPDSDGLELLCKIKQAHPNCEVIIMTGYATVKSAVEAIKLGAYDYLQKPFENLDELESLIQRALAFATGLSRSRPVIDEELGFVVGNSPLMQHVVGLAEKIARKDITVLIQGETGTGKEILARFIHRRSPRSGGPFVAVNCGGFTKSILESELFGHEKGSFTGATSSRRGVFELANHGTLFLDEVAAAGSSIQVQLLRVLETGEFYRVGGEKPIRTEVRIIAASNTDLAREVTAQRFREDLYYRLDVARLDIPPLRERVEDIPIFTDFFVRRHARAAGLTEPVTFSEEALAALMTYPWPGNIRELSNVVAQAIALADNSCIELRHLPAKVRWPQVSVPATPPPPPFDLSQFLDYYSHELVEKYIQENAPVPLPDLITVMRQYELLTVQNIIRWALSKNMGNQQEAARQLGISLRTLRYLWREKQQPSERKPVKASNAKDSPGRFL